MQEKHTHAETEYNEITKNIIIGTNLCCTTSPHAKVLQDLGVSAEIDLEEERQSYPPQIDIYLWTPVVDHTPPTQDQFDAGVAIIEQIVKLDRKVYVHCKLGHGRAPTMVAAYFIYHGLSVEEAVEKIIEKRSEAHLDKVQKDALEKYLVRIRASN